MYHLHVEKGIIKDIKFFGDFFGKEDVSFIEEKLTGVKHSEEGIKEALKDVNIMFNQASDILSRQIFVYDNEKKELKPMEM